MKLRLSKAMEIKRKKIVLIAIATFGSAGAVAALLYYSGLLPGTAPAVERKEATYREELEKEYPAIRDFWAYIPFSFPDGLVRDDITERDDTGDFRVVETGRGKERISLSDDFKVMYQYPGTLYFARMIVERGKEGEFENDKRKAIDEFQFLADTAASKPKKSNAEHNGYEYHYVGNENFLRSPIGMALIFFPEDRVIVTVHFLNQKKEERKFQSLDEFKSLKENFIKGVIDFRISQKEINN